MKNRTFRYIYHTNSQDCAADPQRRHCELGTQRGQGATLEDIGTVVSINVLANYSHRLSEIDLSAVQPMLTATGNEAI